MGMKFKAVPAQKVSIRIDSELSKNISMLSKSYSIQFDYNSLKYPW